MKLITCLTLTCISLTAAADDGLKPINVLLIGNSQCPAIVSNQLLEKLAASDKDARPVKVTSHPKTPTTGLRNFFLS